MDINSVTFSGRLGRDPQMRYTSSGAAVTNFRLAVGVAKDKTLWFDVTVWGKQAEAANQYLTKGSHVGVTGRLDQDEWEGDDGVRRTTLVIRANDVRFLGKKSDSEERPAAPPKTQESNVADVEPLISEGFADDIDDDAFPI